MARRACFHPRSCLRCDARGEACGRHGTGDQGHDRCTGTSVLLCEGTEVHRVDYGVGPVDQYEVTCDEAPRYRLVFEVWDDVAERPVQETSYVCLGHLDEDDVPGAMYHVSTEEIFEEVRV